MEIFKYVVTIFSTIVLLLTSCTVGPNYVRPKTILSTTFKEDKGKSFIKANKNNWKIADPRDAAHRGRWWAIFKDPQLNALEEKLNACNQSIINAIAIYDQSKAIVAEARAAYFPTLTGAFNALRQKSGGGSAPFLSTTNGVTTSGTAATSVSVSNPHPTNTFSAFLNGNWEPDIWGLVRRTVEASVSAAEANHALIAVTRLSLQATLAQNYFEIRSLDTDQQLLDDTVKAYRQSLQLTRNQYASGVASQADIVQAQSQLEVARAQAVNNKILRGQYEHAIAVLIGLPPANYSLPFQPLHNAHPPVIPVMVPTAWLERRPDIAQAERLMSQANAEIGVAIAAFYPTLNLSGSASAAGVKLARLFNDPSTGWSYGLQLAETIYDGGLRKATVQAAKEGYLAQVAAYRQTVLSAFQNVEDSLINLRILNQQITIEKQAAASAIKALHLVTNQYKAGTVNYASVITSQIAAFAAQKTAYDVAGLQMVAAVNLIKAMGGGNEP